MDNFWYWFLFVVIFDIVYVSNSIFIQTLKGFHKHVKNALEIVLLAAFVIAFKIFLINFLPSQNFEIFVPMLFPVLFFNPVYYGILFVVLAATFEFSYFGPTDDTQFEIIAMASVIVLFWAGTKAGLKRIYTLVILMVLVEVAWAIYVTYHSISQGFRFVDWMVQLFYWLFLGLLCLVTKKTISNFIESANLLYQNSLFAIPGYYRNTKAHQKIMNFVVKKRIEIALVGLIEFRVVNRTNDSAVLDNTEVEAKKAEWLANLRASLTSEKRILFKANEKQYGFLIGIDFGHNLTNDYERQAWYLRLTKILKEVRQPHGSAKFDLVPYFGLSVYGIESGDIYRIIWNCEFALQSHVKNSTDHFILFDATVYYEYLNDGIEIARLNQIIKVKNIYPSFVNAYDYQTRTSLFHVAVPTIDFLVSDHDLVFTSIQKSQLWSVFLRYIALKAIKNFGETSSRLALFYASDHIGSPQFKVNSFLQKLAFYQIAPAQIILFFEADYKQVDNQIFWDNIAEFRKHKIEVGASKIGASDMSLDFVLKLRPRYLNLSDEIFLFNRGSIVNDKPIQVYVALANALGAELIYTNVQNFTELKKSIYNKIRVIGGPLLDDYQLKPTAILPQNMNYINEILKESE